MGAGQPPADVKPGSDLGLRTASALVLAILAVLATWLGGTVFALLWWVAGLCVLWEWLRVTRAEPGALLLGVLGFALTALAVELHVGGTGQGRGALAEVWTTAGAALAAALLLGRGGRDRLWAAAGFLYAAVIVMVPPLVRADPARGIVGLAWMFAVVWATDIVAYFVGRAVGGPKLWPLVSPKKTWSGFLGGVTAGTLAGLAVVVLAAHEQVGWVSAWSAGSAALLSALASAASQGGDLAESALKRRFDVKDSSNLIPGHGGVMDRLDGFWTVALGVGLALVLTNPRG